MEMMSVCGRQSLPMWLVAPLTVVALGAFAAV